MALARQERLDHLIPSTDRWWGRSQFATHAGKLERRVYDVPDDIDAEVAKLKLRSMGIAIDTLTEEQQKYLSSWEEGT